MARDYFFSFGSGAPSTFASLAPTFITFANSAGTTYPAPAISERPTGSGIYTCNYGATQTMAFVMDGATVSLSATDRYISGAFDPYDQFGVTLNAAYALGVTSVAIGTTLIGFGTSQIAQGVTLTGFGTSLISQGVTLTGFGTSTIAFGSTLNGFGLSNIALGTTNVFLNTSMGTSLIAIGATLGGLGGTLSAIGLGIGSTASSYGSTAIDPGDLFGYLKRARELAEGNQTYTKATGVLDLFVRGGATLLIEKTIADTATTTTKT